MLVPAVTLLQRLICIVIQASLSFFNRPQHEKCLSSSAVIYTFFCVNISEVNYLTCRYIIHNIHSILNYLQNHRLWRKNGQKLVLHSLENSKITYKIIVCGKKKWLQLILLSSIIQKIIKGFILTTHVQCLLQKQTSQRVAGTLTIKSCCRTIQHKGDILPIGTCSDFFLCPLYIDTAMSISTCHIVLWIFQHSILSTINNSTTFEYTELTNHSSSTSQSSLGADEEVIHDPHISIVRIIWVGVEMCVCIYAPWYD